MTTWTELTPEEKQRAVRQAVKVEGLTYVKAAERFGVSKNSIAGVMNVLDGRKGKKRVRKPPARKNTGNAEPRKAKRSPRLGSFLRLPSEIPIAPDVTPVTGDAWTALPGSTPVPIAEHISGCRWPVGADLPFLFCNEPVAGEKVYCAAHAGIAYRELPTRKDVK